MKAREHSARRKMNEDSIGCHVLSPCICLNATTAQWIFAACVWIDPTSHTFGTTVREAMCLFQTAKLD